MAAIIQDDLRQLGMNVHVVSLEFGAVVNRITKTHDYEACIMGLVSGDADPTPEMNVWLSSGETHLWHPSEAHATTWESEIDRSCRTTCHPQLREAQAAVRSRPGNRCAASSNHLSGEPETSWLLRGTKCETFNPPLLLHTRCGILSSCTFNDRLIIQCPRLSQLRHPSLDSAEPTVWSNTRLVKECLQGSEKAWSALVGRYKNLIFSIPVKYGFSPDEASDIFQAVCLELMSEFPS